MRIGLSAPLDAGEGVVELLGDGADLTAVDHHVLVLPAHLADGGDHSGGAGAPGLVQLAGLGGVEELLGGDELSSTS